MVEWNMVPPTNLAALRAGVWPGESIKGFRYLQALKKKRKGCWTASSCSSANAAIGGCLKKQFCFSLCCWRDDIIRPVLSIRGQAKIPLYKKTNLWEHLSLTMWLGRHSRFIHSNISGILKSCATSWHQPQHIHPLRFCTSWTSWIWPPATYDPTWWRFSGHPTPRTWYHHLLQHQVEGPQSCCQLIDIHKYQPHNQGVVKHHKIGKYCETNTSYILKHQMDLIFTLTVLMGM